jgi:hypothetical protein
VILAAQHIVEVDVSALNFVAGLVVPLLVALLAKWHAPSGLKSVLNLLLSAIAGAVTIAIQADGKIVPSEWITGMGMTWLTSIVSYYGLWKPTNVASVVGLKTRNVGVGPRPDFEAKAA